MAIPERLITEDELSKHLDEVLSEVHTHDTRFSVFRADVVLATIQPAGSSAQVTLREIIKRAGDMPLPSDGFADDLEAIQASQQFPYPSA